MDTSEDNPTDDFLVESTSKLNEEIEEGISITVDASILDYSDIDDESRNLYKSFLTNDNKATVMNTCVDTTNNEWFKDNFAKGKSMFCRRFL